MTYEEVRHLYMPFLQSQGVGPNTIKTAYVDSFYLWRKWFFYLYYPAHLFAIGIIRVLIGNGSIFP